MGAPVGGAPAQGAGNENQPSERPISGQEQPNAGGAPEGEQPKEGGGQPPAETPEQKIARLEAERDEHKAVAQGAVKRATDAERFVSTVTERLKDAAIRGTQPQGRPVSEEEARQQLRERLAEDPDRVLSEHYDARTGPLVQGFLEQQGRTNRELFIAKQSMTPEGKELLSDYMEEVDAFLKDFGPEHRASTDAYDAALRWVRAKPENLKKDIEKGVRKAREAEKTHFAEPASGDERGRKPTTRQLSDIEKEVARGLGISDEDYVKFKEG